MNSKRRVKELEERTNEVNQHLDLDLYLAEIQAPFRKNYQTCSVPPNFHKKQNESDRTKFETEYLCKMAKYFVAGKVYYH